jgi:hypothetical protein
MRRKLPPPPHQGQGGRRDRGPAGVPGAGVGSYPRQRNVTTRYFGWYANRPCGTRSKAAPAAADGPLAIASALRPAPTEASRRRAALLQQIFEVDPLTCPTCHRAMRIVAFITQASVIDQILAHRRPRAAREAHAGPRSAIPRCDRRGRGGRGQFLMSLDRCDYAPLIRADPRQRCLFRPTTNRPHRGWAPRHRGCTTKHLSAWGAHRDVTAGLNAKRRWIMYGARGFRHREAFTMAISLHDGG